MVELWWADPLGASANDYDMYVVDGSNTIVGAFNDIQNGSSDPFEGGFFLTFPGDAFFVFNYNDAPARALHFNVFRSGGAFLYTTGGNVHGHNSANDSFAVAATDASISFPYTFLSGINNSVEPFSSDGPRRKFFYPNGAPITPGNYLFGTRGGTVLAKPDLTSSDGTVTSVPGFEQFFGTSAAAPHAAGITAQILSVFPALTPQEIRTTLLNGTIDTEQPGWDVNSGIGILMSFKAVDSLVNFLDPATVRVTNVTATSADLSWKTPLPSDSYVTLTDPNSGTVQVSDSTPVTDHRVTVTGLTPNTHYSFFLNSVTPNDSVSGFYESNAPRGGFVTKPVGNATLVVRSATGSRDAGGIRIEARIENIGSGAATNVTVMNASLSGVGTTTTLPISVANIGGGQSATVALRFGRSRIPVGATQTLLVTGSYINPATGLVTRFSGTVLIRI